MDYIHAQWQLRRFMSPTRAYRDLRAFLSRRQPHQLLFATLAVALTVFLIFEVAHDSHYQREYRPDIIYFKQWRADRSEAELLAQQKIDQAATDKRQAEVDRINAERRASFKKVDDAMKRMDL